MLGLLVLEGIKEADKNGEEGGGEWVLDGVGRVRGDEDTTGQKGIDEWRGGLGVCVCVLVLDGAYGFVFNIVVTAVFTVFKSGVGRCALHHHRKV